MIDCIWEETSGEQVECLWCGHIRDAPSRRNCPRRVNMKYKTHGPGTHLKLIIESLGIRAPKNCKCKAWISLMDRSGPDWCEKNIEQLVQRLKKQAKRKWKFVPPDFAIRPPIKKAIKRSRCV